MLARLLLGTDPKQRPLRLALLGVALLGIGLRVFNYAVRPPSLWQDEAYWAIKAVKTEAIRAQIRPLGFMLVTQLLLRVLHAAAWVYRLLPFISSLVAMSLAPYVALRLFRSSAARLLSVLLLALSPVALEMAVEFKHYGVEVGVYVGLLAVLLRHREKRTLASLLLLLGVAWVSFFFSITVIFFYPAVFGWLLLTSWQGKRWRQLLGIGGVALLCLGTISTIYFTTWRTIKKEKAESKWGNSYDVFYVKRASGPAHPSRLRWSAGKYFELAGVPGVGRALWQAPRLSEPELDRLKNVDWAVWSALHLAGLAFLLRQRRFAELAALWAPLLFLTAFNLAGRWPGGAFRTNTFYVPFAIFLVCYALEWLPSTSNAWRAASFALCGVLLLPTVYFRPGLVEKGLWAKPGDFTTALAALPTSPPRRERTLIMDYASCRPWDYYTDYDQPMADLGARLRRIYKRRCQRQTRSITAEMNRVATPERGFWMLMTDARKFEHLEGVARRMCQSVDVTFIRGKTHMVLHCDRGKS